MGKNKDYNCAVEPKKEEERHHYPNFHPAGQMLSWR